MARMAKEHSTKIDIKAVNVGRVAVDASIWMFMGFQTLRGERGIEGGDRVRRCCDVCFLTVLTPRLTRRNEIGRRCFQDLDSAWTRRRRRLPRCALAEGGLRAPRALHASSRPGAGLLIHRNASSCMLSQFLAKKAQIFKRKGVKVEKLVIFVFDGDKLPAKERVRAERAERKVCAEWAVRGVYPKRKVKGSFRELGQKVAEKLRGMGWECMEAPYEADHQLAYLAKTGQVAAVVTTDSDLLLYDVPCVLLEVRTGRALRCGRVLRGALWTRCRTPLGPLFATNSAQI